MKPPSEKTCRQLWKRLLEIGITGPDCFHDFQFEEFKRGGILVVVDSKVSGRDLTVIPVGDDFFHGIYHKFTTP